MNTSIVLTIIANDQPGIINTVSEVLQNHGGNWTQSSMSSLAGQFAGILLAQVPGENADVCLAQLQGLESRGLKIIAHVSRKSIEDEKTNTYTLDLVGHDRPGIVHDITTVLTNHGVSVHELETKVESASMAGGELFRAKARLVVPESVNVDTLESDLGEVANELMVDISFE